MTTELLRNWQPLALWVRVPLSDTEMAELVNALMDQKDSVIFLHFLNGGVVQQVEQGIVYPQVAGSSPVASAYLYSSCNALKKSVYASK